MSDAPVRHSRLLRGTKRSLAALAAASIAVGVILIGVPVVARGAPSQRATLPKTASYSLSATITGLPGQSGSVQLSGSLVADLANASFDASLQLPSAIGPIGPGSLELVAVGSTLYVRAPALGSLLGGRSWISISGGAAAATALSRGAGSMAKVVGDVPGAVRWLTSHPAGHPIATVTSTSSSGGSTTTAMLLSWQRPGSSMPRPAGSGWLPSSLPLTLISDSNGRLSSASTSLQVGGATISLSLSSTGYDQPVTVTVPDPTQVEAVPSSTISALMGVAHALGGMHLNGMGGAVADVMGLLRS